MCWAGEKGIAAVFSKVSVCGMLLSFAHSFLPFTHSCSSLPVVPFTWHLHILLPTLAHQIISPTFLPAYPIFVHLCGRTSSKTTTVAATGMAAGCTQSYLTRHANLLCRGNLLHHFMRLIRRACACKIRNEMITLHPPKSPS